MSENTNKLTPAESARLLELCRGLARQPLEGLDLHALRREARAAFEAGGYSAGRSGQNSLVHATATALELCRAVAPAPSMVAAIVLHPAVQAGVLPVADVAARWGDDTAALVEGRTRIAHLYDGGRQAAVKAAENFRDLLLTFARDIRVIIMMIVDRLVLMRDINHHPDQAFVRDVAAETGYLYAPLAHRLGLYKIKSELEDLTMKYTHRQVYTRIARELNAKKAARDAYIAAFIAPVKEKLEQAGLKFEIKGRTKSIASIWNKLRKQQIDVKDVYDLFAIRVIIDSPPQREVEKAQCWHAYSIVSDMYTPNPARLKDWLSIPKSNGYESLHTTVRGPGGKWVEVQIRTRRMDLVAEKGLAAHWRYKGVGGGDQDLEHWMNNIRDILESGAHGTGPLDLMRDMGAPTSDSEVFVFTPKGDLHKLPAGATVLDLAFAIHSGLGCQCTGALVGGKPRKINHRLTSGDTVALLTDQRQMPKADWLGFVVTSKARSKIRQSLKERGKRAAEFGREMLERRARNRKLTLDEALMSRLVKESGYKQATDFFADLGLERLDPNEVLARYEALEKPKTQEVHVSAGEFRMTPADGTGEAGPDGTPGKPHADVLVIGEGVKGLDYRMARCCNPIYGDKVFGFVSSTGAVKIHRDDCPNAADIRRKYPYRLIPVRWSGTAGAQMGVVLSVEGRDDIGIVTNITSIINKEPNVSLRNIQVDADSGSGTFRGTLVVGVADQPSLTALLRKLRTVKGVKSVTRA